MFWNKTAIKSGEYAESIINTVREPLIVLDQELRVVSASRSFYDVFKVTPEETVGQLIYDLGNKQWDIPRLRELLETILPENTHFDDYEVEHNFVGIDRRVMLLNARQIEQEMGRNRTILLAIEDITERSRLENMLEESELQYRRVFETATDGIVLLEKCEGHIVHANPAAEKMLGYAEAELAGKILADIGVPIDMNDFSMIIDSLDKYGILNYEDITIKSKSGQEVRADAYLVNRAKLFQCNLRDITERKRAEKILKEEKRFIENALNTLRDVFFVFDIEGGFIRWNKTLNAVTGYTDREISLKKPIDLFREDEQERVSEAILKVIEEGIGSIEAIIVTKDGRQIPYAFNAAILCDAQNQPAGISGVGRDISVRNKAEADIRKSEERFMHIAQSTNEWIWEVDRDGLYTYSGGGVEEILGYKPEEIVGKKHFNNFFPAEKRAQMEKEASEIFAAKKVFIKHVSVNTHKDGSLVILETNGVPIFDDKGDLLGYRGANVDITGYQRLEAQLRHAQKMEAVGTLAGGIAHDFNNILNVILGYGAMIMDTLEPGSRSKEQMLEVLAAGEKAADLTKRLLIFSSKQVVDVKPVHINEIVLGLQKLLVRIIKESIEFTLDLADMPLIAAADAGQIEQVLINLAANARDAMPEGGQLTISTGLRELDEEYVAAYGYGKAGTYALITVADTGHGMDAETLKKIFEPFFTTKDIGEGTGLGLAVSYGIIKQHSGYIKVYSEPGYGTVFKIYLPISEETASPDKKTADAVPVKGGKETVLVAEDDAPVRILMGTALESFGYSVISATDGEDAIAKFMENRERVSLVLLDVIMPKKSGKEVSEAIKKISPRIKILYTSGYAFDVINAQDWAKPDDDFINKPVSLKTLLIKIREILDR